MRLLWLLACVACMAWAEEVDTTFPTSFAIEGEVVFPADAGASKGAAASRILIDHGKYVGFVRGDGSFKVHGVPSGSYIVQVENAAYTFEPIRVDITSKGKMRGRRLSAIQPNAAHTLPYPLRLQAREATRYFRKREEWRVTDMLMSPMVLMMVLPMLLLFVLPKLTANDPQLQKEMEQMTMPKMDVPDVSEMMASWLGGGKKPAPKKKAVGAPPGRK